MGELSSQGELFIGYMFLLNLWAMTILSVIYLTMVYMEAMEASIKGKNKLNFWLRQGENKEAVPKKF